MIVRVDRLRVAAGVCVVAVLAIGVIGCQEKKPAPVELVATPAPAPTPTETVLAPLDLPDAGPDAAPDAAVKKPTGPGMSTNQFRMHQCCAGLKAQAKALGSGPESAQIMSVAVMCETLAAQVAGNPQGQDPALASLRPLLKTIKLPPVCAGL